MDTEVTDKKPFVFLSLVSFTVVIVGVVIQISTFGGYPLIATLLFIAGIVVAIITFRKIKQISGRGKAWAVIAIIIALMGLFSVVSGFVVKNKFNTLQQEGAQEKMREVWSALQEYKKDNGQCPDNLDQLSPSYLFSTDILYDNKGKSWLQYKVSSDKKNCEVFYGASSGIGL